MMHEKRIGNISLILTGSPERKKRLNEIESSIWEYDDSDAPGEVQIASYKVRPDVYTGGVGLIGAYIQPGGCTELHFADDEDLCHICELEDFILALIDLDRIRKETGRDGTYSFEREEGRT